MTLPTRAGLPGSASSPSSFTMIPCSWAVWSLVKIAGCAAATVIVSGTVLVFPL
jgi:hypothetical protein